MKNIPITVRIPEDMAREIELLGIKTEMENPGSVSNTATITRYALEKYLEEIKTNVLTIKLPLESLDLDEIERLADILNTLYKEIVDKRVEKNPKIKQSNDEWYKDLKDFKSLDNAITELLLYSVKKSRE